MPATNLLACSSKTKRSHKIYNNTIRFRSEIVSVYKVSQRELYNDTQYRKILNKSRYEYFILKSRSL